MANGFLIKVYEVKETQETCVICSERLSLTYGPRLNGVVTLRGYCVPCQSIYLTSAQADKLSPFQVICMLLEEGR